jgi:hypothetical protein
MTTTFAYDDRIGECIVEIFMSGQPNEFGFFVAPNKLLTCAHVIYAGDDPCKIASNSEIRFTVFNEHGSDTNWEKSDPFKCYPLMFFLLMIGRNLALQ